MQNNYEGWQNGQQLDKLWLPEYLILAAKSPQFIVGEGHNIIYITDLLFVDKVCRSSLWPKATTFDKFQWQGDLANFSAKAIWQPLIQVVVSFHIWPPGVDYKEDFNWVTYQQPCQEVRCCINI